MKTILSACLLVTFLTYSSVGRSQTVQNPSFELPAVQTSTTPSLVVPTDWSNIAEDSYDGGLETYTIADETPGIDAGNQVFYIIGRGGIFQDAGSLQPNTTYTLVVAESAPSPSTFYGGAATAPNPPPADNFTVSAWDEPSNNPDPFNNPPANQVLLGTATDTLSTPASGQASFFDSTPVTFTTGSVVSGDLIITLISDGDPGLASSENLFDNVSLVVVPEPSTYMLLSLGMLALFVVSRRRASRKASSVRGFC